MGQTCFPHSAPTPGSGKYSLSSPISGSDIMIFYTRFEMREIASLSLQNAPQRDFDVILCLQCS